MLNFTSYMCRNNGRDALNLVCDEWSEIDSYHLRLGSTRKPAPSSRCPRPSAPTSPSSWRWTCPTAWRPARGSTTSSRTRRSPPC